MSDKRLDYLSDEWFEAADVALREVTAAPAGLTVAVRVVGNDGRADVCYRLVLGPDNVRMIRDDKQGDVRLTMPYAVAGAISQGKVGAQRAFLDGQVQLGGDTTALLGHQAELAAVDDRLVELRARTNFS